MILMLMLLLIEISLLQSARSSRQEGAIKGQTRAKKRQQE
jgi:hypothetical protein